MKDRSTRETEQAREQSGKPGAGKGRKENVRGSGVYPASGPLPPGRAKLKTEAAMGRREPSATAASSRAVMVRRTTVRDRTVAAAVRTPPKRAATRRKFAAALTETPRELAPEDWKDFLDDFSGEHDGWTTDIEVFEPDQTSRLGARGLPLVGVSVDARRGERTVSVIAGEERADHLTHILPRATSITALNENELEIESADRGRTIVRCHQPQA